MSDRHSVDRSRTEHAVAILARRAEIPVHERRLAPVFAVVTMAIAATVFGGFWVAYLTGAS